MKNLYLILKKNSNKTTYALLKNSAEERSVKIKTIFIEEFDLSKKIILNKYDGLYNLCDNYNSQIIEKLLINEDVNTFYSNYLSCINKIKDADDITCYLIHKKQKLPVIKSILSLTSNKDLLLKYVKYLNGLPLIIKSIGGAHGVGVMKIDSLESLYSVADYLSRQSDSFILKEFIDYKEHARLIVLGDQVISSIEYRRIKNDFRSNIGSKLSIKNKKFSKEIEKIAVDAICSMGYEFGGVDILIDKKRQPFIAEINLPCFFPRAQKYSGVDISGAMIDYLIEKSKNKINICNP